MKQKWTNYTFSPGNAGAGTVTLTGLNITLDQVLIIADATRNTLIYNFADSTAGATAFTQAANSVLTLTANTTGYSASDKLTIYYDDNASPASVAVNSLPAIPAGSNAIGTVAVSTLPAIPAGSNAIGTVGVTSLPAIPTGSNTIGNVGIAGNVTLNSLPSGTNSIGNVTINGTVPVSGNVGITGNVTVGATENHLGEIGGRGVAVSASFTRPANTTAYAANYVVSNSTSATTLLSFSIARVNAGTGYITGARLVADQKSITPRFRVHLFNASPTVSADGALNKELYADESKVIGVFDLPAMTTPGDTTNSTVSRAYDYTIRIPFKCASGTTTIYAYLETLDAYTPSSGGGYTLTLLADLD